MSKEEWTYAHSPYKKLKVVRLEMSVPAYELFFMYSPLNARRNI
jgi:hypothetical protein